MAKIFNKQEWLIKADKQITEGTLTEKEKQDALDIWVNDADGKTYEELGWEEPTEQRPDIRLIEYKIEKLKQNLDKTDYQAIKFAEGQMTAAEYEPMKQQRQAWRNEINTLESQINV